MLAACGGGGGGGGNTIREVPFTSFSAAAPNETVVMPGVSLIANATATTFDINLPDDANSAMRLTYDGGRNLAGINISTPSSSVAFGANDVVCSTGACGALSPDLSAIAVVINPLDPLFNWNYQTFGVWLKDTSPTSFQAGAISAGAVSPVSALPLSTGTFTGHAGGWWIDSVGTLHTTDADMTVVADFGAQSIVFSTSTTIVDASVVNNELNLTGNLSYGSGNQFSGPVSTLGKPSNPLSGTATGRFYGPNAEEIGGVYGLGASNGERMIGGFGGKRP
jgi:hypothetical protein